MKRVRASARPVNQAHIGFLRIVEFNVKKRITKGRIRNKRMEKNFVATQRLSEHSPNPCLLGKNVFRECSRDTEPLRPFREDSFFAPGAINAENFLHGKHRRIRVKRHRFFSTRERSPETTLKKMKVSEARNVARHFFRKIKLEKFLAGVRIEKCENFRRRLQRQIRPGEEMIIIVLSRRNGGAQQRKLAPNLRIRPPLNIETLGKHGEFRFFQARMHGGFVKIRPLFVNMEKNFDALVVEQLQLCFKQLLLLVSHYEDGVLAPPTSLYAGIMPGDCTKFPQPSNLFFFLFL